MRYRVVLALALFWLLALAAWPHPAHAAEVETGAMVLRCDEPSRLAGIVETEAFSQPTEAQIAIAQIVFAEARSRAMTVCALSEQTHFVSVYRYALANPGSWHARQFAHVEPWALSLASDVLAGVLPDFTRGAGHFDGADHTGEPTVWQSGQIRFFP